MVAATQQQQHQHQQQQQQQQHQHQQQQQPTPSAEEEALKRNTDCVYFLASPLTCKKGSECEYRHSEYARVNPRDCYFWLNGNCLNPKCGFRHPPLDGLYGNQAAASGGVSLPPSHTGAPVAHTPYNSGKQAVPCVFFQKGMCLKGDKCAFLHGVNPPSNKVSQQVASTAGTESQPLKKVLVGLQKCTQEPKIPQASSLKVVETPPVLKPAPKGETAPPRNVVGVERMVKQPKSMDDEVVRYKTANTTPIVNGSSSRSNCLPQSHVADDHGFQNGKDADEFLRESSPGFDVLVDDELRDSDYYHGDDQYGRARAHERRNLDDYDLDPSADYSSMVDIEQETYHDPQGYDSYEHLQGQFAWEQHRASSERTQLEPAHLLRRGYSKGDSPEGINESDLRYHLSKRKKANGLRSVVSHDFAPYDHIDERGYRGSSRRESRPLSSHESSIGSRLHGRIKVPRRSPTGGNDLHLEREMDKGRNRGRLSPGRPQRSSVPSHQGRLHDRIKHRVEEEYDNQGRNFSGPRMRREELDENIADFAGPKSLAELKVTKNAEGSVQQSLGKRKQLEDYRPSEGDLSFEGPMPLGEILKKKREAEAAASGGGRSSVNKDSNNERSRKDGLLDSSNSAAYVERQSGLSSASKDETDSQVLNNKDESKSAAGGARKTEVENIKDVHGQSSQPPNEGELETEDGMYGEDGMEYQEYEGDDQRDGDYEYEQGDEGDYNYEEGENMERENADAEEEYVDDEDGDDFAKKIGVMFS